MGLIGSRRKIAPPAMTAGIEDHIRYAVHLASHRQVFGLDLIGGVHLTVFADSQALTTPARISAWCAVILWSFDFLLLNDSIPPQHGHLIFPLSRTISRGGACPHMWQGNGWPTPRCLGHLLHRFLHTNISIHLFYLGAHRQVDTLSRNSAL